MGIEEVMYLLLTDLRTPTRDAYVIYNAFSERCASLIQTAREGVIEALRYLMQTRSEFDTFLSIYVAGKLKLHELKPDIEEVRKDFIDGKFPETQIKEPSGHFHSLLQKSYLADIDRGLDVLK